jgi:hypothetical protein
MPLRLSLKEPAKSRPSGSLLVSLAVHAVLAVGLVYLLSMPFPLQEFLKHRRVQTAPTERISFIAFPDRGVNTPGRSGGDGRPVRPRKARPPLVAPTTTPQVVSPPPAAPAKPEPESGSGPLVGKGGATEGLVPSFSDPRLWVAPGPVASAPKTPAERLDSSLVSRLQAHLDSVQSLASGEKPADWTVKKGDKKYGLDQHNIYLGSFKIPSALLALLPLNVQANPGAAERSRALSEQHMEIMEQAQRASNDDDFKAAVKRIRERKWQERQRRLEDEKKQQQQEVATPVTP